jgi:hypothetical protein
VAEVPVAGAVAAGLAGAAVGAIDALWSWRALAQFTPGLFERACGSRLYLATSYAIAGSLVGAGLARSRCIYSRVTRLGRLSATPRASTPPPGPAGIPRRVVGLSLVLSFARCRRWRAGRG